MLELCAEGRALPNHGKRLNFLSLWKKTSSKWQRSEIDKSEFHWYSLLLVGAGYCGWRSTLSIGILRRFLTFYDTKWNAATFDVQSKKNPFLQTEWRVATFGAALSSLTSKMPTGTIHRLPRNSCEVARQKTSLSKNIQIFKPSVNDAGSMMIVVIRRCCGHVIRVITEVLI